MVPCTDTRVEELKHARLALGRAREEEGGKANRISGTEDAGEDFESTGGARRLTPTRGGERPEESKRREHDDGCLESKPGEFSEMADSTTKCGVDKFEENFQSNWI